MALYNNMVFSWQKPASAIEFVLHYPYAITKPAGPPSIAKSIVYCVSAILTTVTDTATRSHPTTKDRGLSHSYRKLT